ncbi:MAG: lipoate--protein ligase family protein [Pirellulales bacterium]
MLLLDLTLPSPAENLALDEALLEDAERGLGPGRLLRLWESSDWAVVLGRSSRHQDEVQCAAAAAEGIPVLRRASGGGTVLIGPGCLLYTVLLPYADDPSLQMIEVAHRYVLERIRQALTPLVPGVELQGTSDLVLAGRKFSGNSLRCRRAHLLYHGTLLYDFPLERVGRILGTPARQPAYRAQRSHVDFLCNLPLTAAALRAALIRVWEARELCSAWPAAATRQLVAERYSQASWNLRL